MEKYTAIIEKSETGFSAYCEDYPIFTTGKTISEIKLNLVEAAKLHFDNGKITADQIELRFDLRLFFKYYRVLNTKYLAERIGINNTLFSQYVQGKKKPSEKQTQKILEGVHMLAKELNEIKSMYV